MQLNHQAVTTPPITAASVVVLRDGASGLEVLLLKRHSASGTFGGAHVFPGGKVDPADRSELGMALLDQPLNDLHRQLAEPELSPEDAAALYLAAVRETFEECGLLWAQSSTTRHGSARGAHLVAEQVHRGDGFAAAMQSLHMQVQTQALHPWSRWITPRVPSVSSKRFDTRFFVAEAPKEQVARHDDHEATEAIWLAPREGLAKYWAGEIDLAPPQIMSLTHLARHPNVGEVLAEARQRPPPVIQPEPFELDGMRVVCYPGDPRHSVPTRALPGPTRLFFRAQRFEPAGGLQDLLP